MATIKDLISKEILDELTGHLQIDKSKKISQHDITLIQLKGAIILFNTGENICSITLAGAAEEIFGKMAYLKTKGRKGFNTITLESDLYELSFGMNKGEYIEYRNRIKNELKHLNQSWEVEYENFKDYAVQLISSAITNYKIFKGELPSPQIIRDFCKKYGVS